MNQAKPIRPPFQSIVLDDMDARLEAKAAEKGIPTLVTPKSELAEARAPEPAAAPAAPVAPRAAPLPTSRAPVPREAPQRSARKGLKIELPPYAWIELKKRTAEEMVSMRYFVMDALRTKGIHIDEADMIDDGRRYRD